LVKVATRIDNNLRTHQDEYRERREEQRAPRYKVEQSRERTRIDRPFRREHEVTRETKVTERDRRPRGDVECYNCGKKGHIRPDCPEKKDGHQLRAADVKDDDGQIIDYDDLEDDFSGSESEDESGNDPASE
jgi:hypothetical protein